VIHTIRLAAIPGDGIGPEVLAEAHRVLEIVVAGAGAHVETTTYDLGARRWLATGELLPASVLAEIRGHDAILLGAIGDPAVPPGVLERGLLLQLRFALDHHVNLRPSRTYAGVASPVAACGPGDLDLLVVREGTEGMYAGSGGALRAGTPHEVATEESINTAYGIERVVRYAFQRAADRPRRQVTLVHKTNVLTYAGELWRRVAAEVAEDFPGVRLDYCHVDAAAMYLVTDPARFDVIVTDNLFGDILTDLAAAVSGGIGLAASANLDTTRTNPSMFEPVHGSAPDIAGQGIADPTAAILSVALLVDHIGLPKAAAQVEEAVAADLAERPTLGPRSTRAIGDAVVGRLGGGENGTARR
jgi:3-isopropylmalate dehydrogenase